MKDNNLNIKSYNKTNNKLKCKITTQLTLKYVKVASLKILTKCIGFKERMTNDNKIRSINNINKKWDLTTSTQELRKYLAIEKC